MEANDWVTSILAAIAIVVSIVALLDSRKNAKRQEEQALKSDKEARENADRNEEFSKRLKKVEIRDSKVFQIVDEGGKLINAVNGANLTYYQQIREHQIRGDMTAAHNLVAAIKAFGYHTTNAEQHLPDDLMVEFRKMRDANVYLYQHVSNVTSTAVYLSAPFNALGDLNTALVQWEPKFEHFKEVLKTFSRQVN